MKSLKEIAERYNTRVKEIYHIDEAGARVLLGELSDMADTAYFEIGQYEAKSGHAEIFEPITERDDLQGLALEGAAFPQRTTLEGTVTLWKVQAIEFVEYDGIVVTRRADNEGIPEEQFFPYDEEN